MIQLPRQKSENTLEHTPDYHVRHCDQTMEGHIANVQRVDYEFDASGKRQLQFREGHSGKYCFQGGSCFIGYYDGVTWLTFTQ